MKGYLWPAPESARGAESPTRLPRWEAIAVDAVGNVIEFWGFKRNQGRVWALLFLRGGALSAGDIEQELALSKGAVSMLIRDMERWDVLRRVRSPGRAAWHYAAETDLMRMVSRVLEQREAAFLERVREDLSEAKRLAHEAGDVPRERLDRLDRMTDLAEQTDRAVRLFLRTARLDVGGMFEVLRERVAPRREGR